VNPVEPPDKRTPDSLFEQYPERGRSDVVHFLKTACSPLDKFILSN
jgi:hypothetical protein